jgi:KDO2-lipid IV(A) lauroyltransferase
MLAKIGIFFLKGFSRLPFNVLYLLSDLFYVVVFKFIGYRKKVVYNNLKSAFPKKSEKERKQIADKFFRFLSDLIFESLKSFSLTAEELKKRVIVENVEVLYKYLEQNQSLIFVLGHYGNWEFAQLRYSLQDKRHKFNGIYKKIKNPEVEKFMFKSRSRFGTSLIETKNAYKVTDEEFYKKIPTITALIGDQAAPPDKGYWTTFLNQDTSVFLGCENMSIKYNMPVVYVQLHVISRGFYKMSFETIVENPRDTMPGYITDSHTKYLESIILQKPEFWLWSHKRWKHKRPQNTITGSKF